MTTSVAFPTTHRAVATGLVPAMVVIMLSNGCSMKTVAANKLGDALAQSGTTFSGDDDPELIRAAAPFSLKLMESLIGSDEGRGT